MTIILTMTDDCTVDIPRSKGACRTQYTIDVVDGVQRRSTAELCGIASARRCAWRIRINCSVDPFV